VEEVIQVSSAEGGARILVYGAGPLGSLFAGLLQQGGNDVSLLARGRRLADLREHGVILHNVISHEETATRVRVVEELAPEDSYDLVLVIMRKNHALQILPTLAANNHTPNVLFLMNNAAGPDQLTEALGRERVLIGFPGCAGYREGHVMHVLTGSDEDPASVPFGELGGQVTWRTRQVGRWLDSAPGLQAEIRTDMDAWLKYHVALLFPSLAPALSMCGVDNYRMARTRDGIVLALRAIREGFAVLKSLGLRPTPARLRVFSWLPEPVLVRFLRRVLSNELMETALIKHAEAAHDEVLHLVSEFDQLIDASGVPTPTIDRLRPELGDGVHLLPDGSATIPMRWGGLAAALAVGAMLIVGIAALLAWIL
jgi:2-dehydropantoate 2-reductase